MNENKAATKGNIVESAIAAWKREHPGTAGLSDSGRNRVLRSGLQPSSTGEMPRLFNLFPAYRRIALAAFIPVALVTTVLVLSLSTGPGELDPVAISVEKVGNQVVFNIANGGTVHSVSKSNSPQTFDPGEKVRIQDGSYRDSMVDNGDLVFYRID